MVQGEAVRLALEEAGCSVVELPFLPSPSHPNPTADFLLAGKLGMTYLFVVKGGSQKTLLTPTERKWLDEWWGIVFVVDTPEQALACLNKSLDNLTET